MITVLTSHRVADYDDWKAAYDRTDSGPLASDVRSYRIWRDLDDPNLVIVAETFESREIAEATLAHPELAEAIVKAGVDTASMKLQFVEEVASPRSSRRVPALLSGLCDGTRRALPMPFST